MEPARFVSGVERNKGDICDKTGLKIIRTVCVEGTAHLGGITNDFMLVAGALSGRGVADLAIRKAA